MARSKTSVILAAVMSLSASALADVGDVVRANVSTGGAESNQISLSPVISPNGRVVAFASRATTLVPEDTNTNLDVFVRDLDAKTTTLASINNAGTLSNTDSNYPSLSYDGRFVAFESYSKTWPFADKNSGCNIYVRDRQLGLTELCSPKLPGTQAQWALSRNASISADGRYVAFQSDAPNLVPGDTNLRDDVFVFDRMTRTTERMSRTAQGGESNNNCWIPAISGDGRFVIFNSPATNLTEVDPKGLWQLYVRDRILGTLRMVSIANGQPLGVRDLSRSYLSYDGRFIAFDGGGSPYGYSSPMVYDQLTQTIQSAGLNDDGQPQLTYAYIAPISGDGRVVGFAPYVRDIAAQVTEPIVPNTQYPVARFLAAQSISYDGRFVVFLSDSQLVSDDTNFIEDVYVVERQGEIPQITVSGHIYFGDLAGPQPFSVRIDVRRTGHYDARQTVDVAVQPDGSYEFQTTGLAMQMSLQHTHWLRQTTGSLAGYLGDVTNVDFDLINGDANHDNLVSVFDYGYLLYDFGKTGSEADLDEDGVVTVWDLMIFLMNFGAVGDF
jgi:Tol biopolymer transport system component